MTRLIFPVGKSDNDEQKENKARQGRNVSCGTNYRPVEAAWTKDHLTELFKSCDKDNDGMLSFQEVETAFRRLGPHNKLWAFFKAEKIDCHIKARKGMDFADLDNDERIDLRTELTDLVKVTLKLGYTIN
ncbi:hypothetical protein L484_006330 [Morus notabilis]|uniref:EF-hand domain-containing protein n=1 Tax=Morus notabilis TaxID=981085 RepID=W9S828_9ROSA|nr:hypothetical protein L484_006330 [Morus notabilis]